MNFELVGSGPINSIPTNENGLRGAKIECKKTGKSFEIELLGLHSGEAWIISLTDSKILLQ